jgi:uncharacterized protein (TIGR00725 family)
MNISVFGGSKPKPGESAYQDAYRLGKLLGQAGHTVLNGGYIGTMEAVSKGASETGAQVIGVTCEEIESWRPVGANPYITQEKRYQTIHQRMLVLIQECDAAMALPGGSGTMTEISLTWNLLIIGAITPRPLILIGKGWQHTYDQFFAALGDYVPEEHRKWLLFAQGVDAAIRRLDIEIS